MTGGSVTRTRWIVLVVLVAAAVACGVSPASTSTGVAGTTTTALPDRPLRGFSLSPRSYDQAGLAEFFAAAADGDFVERVGDVIEWEGSAGTALGLVDAAADERGMASISITGVFDVADGSLLRPLDHATFDRYIAAARSYAAARQPEYLGLGVEIDTQWRTHPEDFDRFVELFTAVAGAVHEVSPETRMLTAFQLERLSGMQGGIFGGDNDPSLAAWDLIDRFPDADVIGFTTYPGLVFASPADLPDDYYRSIGAHTGGRPIAFTEMGWQAAGDFGEYSGSEQEQAEFVARFAELTAGVDVAFSTWSFLYDQTAPGPFASMGLLRSDGLARPAWDAWRAAGEAGP